jgi:hypothetical protein
MSGADIIYLTPKVSKKFRSFFRGLNLLNPSVLIRVFPCSSVAKIRIAVGKSSDLTKLKKQGNIKMMIKYQINLIRAAVAQFTGK